MSDFERIPILWRVGSCRCGTASFDERVYDTVRIGEGWMPDVYPAYRKPRLTGEEWNWNGGADTLNRFRAVDVAVLGVASARPVSSRTRQRRQL